MTEPDDPLRPRMGLTGLINGSISRVSDTSRVPSDKLDALRVLLKHGRAPDVVRLGTVLLKSHPTSGALQTIVAIAHQNLGRTEYALNLLVSAVEAEPGLSDAHHALGVNLFTLGRTEEAVAAFEAALAIDPMSASAYRGLGDVFRTTGSVRAAIRHYKFSLEQDAQQPSIHINLGTCFQQIGQLDEAARCYDVALSMQPLNIIALNNKAICLNLRKHSEAAINCFRAALCIAPHSAETWNNLGICLKDAERHREALLHLTKAVSLNPELVDAHVNICEIHEISNETEALRKSLRKADDYGFSEHPHVQYYRALIHLRDKDYSRASDLIKSIHVDGISMYRLNSFYSVKGKILDKAEDFDSAFEAFAHMNRRLLSSPSYAQIDAKSYLADLKSLNAQLEQSAPLEASAITGADVPAFLVGFPRSGTTLLETILFSHSRVVVLDEKPAVDQSLASVGRTLDLKSLMQLSESDTNGMRTAYFEEVGRHLPSRSTNSLLIDKLPLNSVQAPLIHKMFPNAKFILAIRHPLDCILSCYMQNFGLNAAMANMLDLERIVDFYCLTMEIWTRSQQVFNLQVHMLRYEDLVVDMPGEVADLLGFLGLEWEDAVHGYQSTALQRGVINTPSYSQVTQPLYQDASYRWKNYTRYLEPYFERVRPWISHFGYEDT
jgi:tetratricopeptide (TPR) repeat protein